jgi:tetratricopeptide (TPR) repeat protein
MQRSRLLAGISITFTLAAGAQQPQYAASAPPLYSDLGRLTHPIATKNAKAQAYFDQGIRLYYGFNQEESARAFRQAAHLDPLSPMPHWGVAMALGPNVNVSMDTAAERQAYAEMQEAKRLAANGNARDRAYIDAITVRFSPVPGTERGKRDSLYADKMRAVVKQHPEDQDAAVLLAESLMLLHPWDWFKADGTPVGSILEAIGQLERVTKANPNHPGACHFYIHAVEQSHTPQRALPCADRLPGLMPGAGHLVHMPAHIYMRTGNYAEAVTRNQHAAHADEVFIGEQKPQGVYPLYYAHNLHFLWAAAAMDGQTKVSLQASRDLVKSVPIEIFEQVPLFEMIAAVPVLALTHFAKWDDVLREPAPKPTLKLARAMWHHARGVAYARTNRPDSAARELADLRAVAAQIPADQLVMTTNTAPQVTKLAEKTVEAEIALARGQTADGIARLREAVILEDDLRYDEPATWYSPVRQRLGRILLATGRSAEAEKAFREDLLRNPENGWSLDGLGKSLKAQGKSAEAADVEKRFKKVWVRADVSP